jgi:hypothetical protein
MQENTILNNKKRNKVLTHATTYDPWEKIMLTKISQTPKVTNVRFHLYEMSSIGKPIDTESRIIFHGEWREG